MLRTHVAANVERGTEGRYRVDHYGDHSGAQHTVVFLHVAVLITRDIPSLFDIQTPILGDYIMRQFNVS